MSPIPIGTRIKVHFFVNPEAYETGTVVERPDYQADANHALNLWFESDEGGLTGIAYDPAKVEIINE